MGADLMRRWDLPQLIISCIRHHHEDGYAGQHRHEVLLIQLANRLLKGHGMGDEATDDIPPELLKTLCLDMETVQRVSRNVMDCRDTFETMVSHMAA